MTSTFGPSCLLPYPKWLTKGVFNSPFTPKNSRFWSIILHNGTKHHAKFLAKSGYSLFWILASRAKKKRASRGYNEGNKFRISDKPNFFGIFHFIIPKLLIFCIPWGIKQALKFILS
jgi:hypothetical protein